MTKFAEKPANVVSTKLSMSVNPTVNLFTHVLLGATYEGMNDRVFALGFAPEIDIAPRHPMLAVHARA